MPYKTKHDPNKPKQIEDFRALAQALRTPAAMSVDRGSYIIGITSKPIIMVRPKTPLTDNQRAVLAELIHTLMDIPALPTKNLIGAIDHWFEVQAGSDVPPRARTQATDEDLEPVVLIAKPVDGI